MRQPVIPNLGHTGNAGCNSWYENFRAHPIETAYLLSLTVERLARTDKIPLTRFHATAVGKLFNQLSMPVLLINRFLRVAFANKACRRISRGCKTLVGLSATSIFSEDSAPGGCHSLIEGIFAHRKPLVLESRVRVGKDEIPGRSHFHMISMGRKRLLLVIVEDLTRQAERESSIEPSDSESCHNQADLSEINRLLSHESARHERVEQMLRPYNEKNITLNHRTNLVETSRFVRLHTASEPMVINDRHDPAMHSKEASTPVLQNTAPKLPRQERTSHPLSARDADISRILPWTTAHAKAERALSGDGRVSGVTDLEGRRDATMLSAQDETRYQDHVEAMRRSEETALALLSMSDDAVVLLDTQGVVLASNEVFARRIGLTVEQFVGRNLIEFFPQHLAEERLNRGREAIEKGHPVRFSDERDGRLLENTVCPLFDEHGSVRRLAVVSRDVTDRFRRISEWESVSEEAQLVNRAKSEFLANVSHELRTPLNAIIGFSEILEDQLFGRLNEKQMAYVGHVLSSGRQLLHLIDNILDLANVESGEIELHIAGVNVRRVLEDCMVLMRERTSKQGLKTHLRVADDLADMAIEADQVKLKQIVFNLLSNAAKFTPRGGEIGVRADKEGDEVVVSVSDTGIGLKPEDQDRVFHAFEQVDSSHTRQHPGTGLGLALTKKMVELHGGRIWVESRGEGLGSTFSFAIPISSPLPEMAETR